MRPIDADWLLDVVENIIKWDTERDRNRIIHQVRELTPTIEPERKTGKWIKLDYTEAWEYKCDQCGRMSDFEENYCPNCGSYNGEQP